MTERSVPAEPLAPGTAVLTLEALWQALDASPDGFVLVDDAGTVVQANRQAEQLFGYDEGCLSGVSVEALMDPALIDRHRDHRAAYEGAPQVRPMGARQVLSGRRRDGGTFPVEISLSPLVMADQRLVVATIRDVTERRSAEAELSEARQAVAVADERERIGRDLHDTVIQRLFAAGMTLQAAVGRLDPGDEATERISNVIDQLDDTIREIRGTIFSLHQAPLGGSDLIARLMATVAEVTKTLAFEPGLAVTGRVELVSPDLTHELVATVREALTNISRHAEASSAAVAVDIDELLVLRVSDDGVGFTTGRPGGRGLSNMIERATGLGGRCVISAPGRGGTEVVWQVPLGGGA